MTNVIGFPRKSKINIDVQPSTAQIVADALDTIPPALEAQREKDIAAKELHHILSGTADIAERALNDLPKMTTPEIKEITRHFHKFHNEMHAIEQLMRRMLTNNDG